MVLAVNLPELVPTPLVSERASDFSVGGRGIETPPSVYMVLSDGKNKLNIEYNVFIQLYL